LTWARAQRDDDAEFRAIDLIDPCHCIDTVVT
jgi:hypothetical protein